MTIEKDSHVHSSISPDAMSPMEDMCEAAIQKGLKEIVFTDHYECYCDGVKSRYFHPEYVKHYFSVLAGCRERFEGKLRIYSGLELGQSHLDPETSGWLAREPFDFILGSVHKLGNVDLAWIQLKDTNKDYIAETYYANLLKLAERGTYDALGHLDFVKKHFARCGLVYEESRYEPVIRQILKTVIAQGKIIEINTACMGRVLEDTMPGLSVLQWYGELGGRWVSAGSDSHYRDRLGYGFEKVEALLSETGLELYRF